MKRLVAVLLMLALLAGGLVAWMGLRGDPAPGAASPLGDSGIADPIERGRYLATVGDCRACHTVAGGADYAGGRAIPTPFGRFYAPNITPDRETGIGSWTADDFWGALHEGKSRDGSLLYPSFPYTNYTRLSRADADAMFAYLQTVPAVAQPRRAHELRFPYNHRLLLVGWRALFFRPGVYEPDPAQNADWNRGAYLVQGLGHCSACHEARNALGAVQSKDTPAGGLVLSWYAPALSSGAEAGLRDWSRQEIVDLLRSGVSARGSALGPMAEVVYESLQHASEADLQAMAGYLQSLPETGAPDVEGSVQVAPAHVPRMLAAGEALYRQHCADCHGAAGEGSAPAAPALAGNRAVNLGSAVNPIRVLLFGGYPPGTAGNPRPFGMPPFAGRLSDEEIAQLLTYVRASWGNEAAPVSPVEVGRNRSGPLW